MRIVNMHDAKSQLSDLVKRAEGGEEIVIARNGEPAVKLVAVEARAAGRAFGALKGRIAVPAAFFEPLPDEELEPWEGPAA